MKMEANELIEQPTIMSNTDLAFERTVMAENRTLMAWIRTAISLISFGFTIYKFFHEAIGSTHRLISPRKIGMFMIGVGVLALAWGYMEFNDNIKKIKKSYPAVQRSRSAWLALIILVFGIALFITAWFKQ